MHLLSIASTCVLATYIILCLTPPLRSTVRKHLRPRVLQAVLNGIPTVCWAQSLHSQPLTAAFNWAACTVSVSFYACCLPPLLWVRCVARAPGPHTRATTPGLWLVTHLAPRVSPRADHLRWQLCQGTTSTAQVEFTTNSPQDLFGAPRPFSIPSRQGSEASVASCSSGSEATLMADTRSEDFTLHAKEYGLPSSHTMNTLALTMYAVPHAAALAPEPYRAMLSAMLYIAAGLWVGVIAFSRMYLGFHTPVDLYTGAVLAAACLHAYSAVDSALDAVLVRPGPVGVFVLAALTLAMRLHPCPVAYTPSFEFSVSFLGCSFGLGMARYFCYKR